MSNYLIEKETLIDIANAIREKTGSTNSIKSNDMANMIQNIKNNNISETSEVIKHAEIPKYVKDEVVRVADLVNKVKKDNSIVFLAMSDSHHCGVQDDTGWQPNINTGNWHAVQAAKALSYALDLDFSCHLGDITFGSGTTTSEWLHQQAEEMSGWLDESQLGVPTFMSLGNHDTGMYAVNDGTESQVESADYLFSVFGARCEGAVYGDTTHGYCYRDFDSKKLRVICLNSCERHTTNGYSANPSMSEAQFLWFAQALQGVGSKTDALDWCVLVLSHYPLDYANCYKASSVVKAYMEGKTIALNGTTVNFNGANNARFVANFHGHTHCFKYARLNEVNGTTLTSAEYDAWRIAVPNSCFYRNNHQIDVDKHGISFKDTETYNKTSGEAKDTAFVVNVIDPDEKVVHSFAYGAGTNRVVSYGDAVYYKVVTLITGATIDNASTHIREGASYTATITPKEHYSVSSIEITMGGVDVTSSVYSNGVIDIESVTGDINITVVAEIALACTNWIPKATDINGNIYNGKGFKENTMVTSSNEYGNSETDATGYIPIKHADIVRMENMVISPASDENCITFYDSNYDFLFAVKSGSSWYWGKLAGVTNSNGDYIQFTMNTTIQAEFNNAVYMRITANDISTESILTINEEIKYLDELDGAYSITNNLSNATTNNTAITVAGGSKYTATITLNENCTLEGYSVTMGGVDITSTAYNNGVITIEYVTGNVVITVTAKSAPTYINLIPISTDADGNVYNGKGYKENTYLSSGNDGIKTGIYATGFIPCGTYRSYTVRLKNVNFDKDHADKSYHRIAVYDANKTHLVTFNSTATTTAYQTKTDENGVWTEFKFRETTASVDTTNMAYFRLCCSYIGEDSVITINEVIDD